MKNIQHSIKPAYFQLVNILLISCITLPKSIHVLYALGIGIPNMNKIESIKRFYFPYPSSKLFSIVGAMLNAMNFMENLKNLFFSRLRHKIFVVTGYHKILQ